jgi:hypothetical protein
MKLYLIAIFLLANGFLYSGTIKLENKNSQDLKLIIKLSHNLRYGPFLIDTIVVNKSYSFQFSDSLIPTTYISIGKISDEFDNTLFESQLSSKLLYVDTNEVYEESKREYSSNKYFYKSDTIYKILDNISQNLWKSSSSITYAKLSEVYNLAKKSPYFEFLSVDIAYNFAYANLVYFGFQGKDVSSNVFEEPLLSNLKSVLKSSDREYLLKQKYIATCLNNFRYYIETTKLNIDKESLINKFDNNFGGKEFESLFLMTKLLDSLDALNYENEVVSLMNNLPKELNEFHRINMLKICNNMKDIFGRSYSHHIVYDSKGNGIPLSNILDDRNLITFTHRGCGGCVFSRPYVNQIDSLNLLKGKIKSIKLHVYTSHEDAIEDFEDELKGYYSKENHYYVIPQWNSPLMRDVDKSALPSFIKLDKNGKVVDYNPPYPSFNNDKQREEYLNRLFKEPTIK